MSQHDAQHHGGHAAPGSGSTTSPALIAGSWALVGVPLAYGLWQTLVKASQLFGG